MAFGEGSRNEVNDRFLPSQKRSRLASRFQCHLIGPTPTFAPHHRLFGLPRRDCITKPVIFPGSSDSRRIIRASLQVGEYDESSAFDLLHRLYWQAREYSFQGRRGGILKD